MAVRYIQTCRLPTPFGVFDMHGFEEPDTGKEHVALTLGDLNSPEPMLARTHSECLTGDALYSMRCDCGYQLETALSSVAKAGRGVVLYLRQEGRGIGLYNKIDAYRLQSEGMNTYEANNHLGFGDDLRDFTEAAEMLRALGTTKIRLVTNNPKKINELKSFGIEIEEVVNTSAHIKSGNESYLKAKVSHGKHNLDI